MSTATPVPETWELTGDDAPARLLHLDTGRRKLIRDAFQRLAVGRRLQPRALARVLRRRSCSCRRSSRSSGSRTALGKNGASELIVRSLRAAAPGPAGEFLTSAVIQAQHAGATHRYAGLVLGLVGAIITGTTLMGQVERALNRIYGIEQDRPTVQKYGLAFAARAHGRRCSTVLAFARSGVRASRSATGIQNTATANVWAVVRWPLALVLMMAAMALLFRWSPRRHQPAWSWLAFGASVSVLLWTTSRSASAVLPRRARRSATPTDRSPASWRCCCGRCSRRSRCCTARRSPRSSRRCARARPSPRTRRRSRTPSRTQARALVGTTRRVNMTR